MKPRSLPVVVLFMLMASGVLAQPASIQGTWKVTAVLVVTSTPNPHVKEGHMKEETWQLVQQGDQATLATPAGTIQGRFLPVTQEFPQGVWRFELAVPYFLGQPTLGARFEVSVLRRSANLLSGGSSVTYYNTFAGQWSPMGIESWRFDASRIQ